MQFNVSKCCVIHLGKNNARYNYTINGEMLNEFGEQKDLGVTLAENLKPSSYCIIIYKRANKALGMISRHIIYICHEKFSLNYASR